MSVSFVTPLNLVFLLSLLFALALIVYGFVRRQKVAAATFSTNLASLLLPANRLRYWCRAVLTLCALALLVVALAKPQWGTETRDIDRSGRDLLLLVDVSISMLAEDATPNRLSVAIGGIRDFVERLRVDGGHRIALLAFAGRASPAAPLTVDYDLFLSRLDDVDTQSTLRRGSHIGDAIRQALYSFGTLDHKYTDIIIISDGEDHGSAPLDAARVAAGLGVSIHTVGIGDSTDGALIPFHSQDGGQYVKVNNTEIISRMQPGLLVELARLTGGRFISVGTGTAALGDFYDDHLASKPTRRIEVLASERKIHRFQWFIALALVLLVLEIVLNRESNSLQKMRQNYRPGSEVLAPVLLIGFTVALLMTYPKGLTANSHEANEFMQQGQRDYERGDFHAAAENFSKATSLLPDSAIGYYNHATARFKLYDYAAAIEHFTIALQSADQASAGNRQHDDIPGRHDAAGIGDWLLSRQSAAESKFGRHPLQSGTRTQPDAGPDRTTRPAAGERKNPRSEDVGQQRPVTRGRW